jgi:hypothetical protein
LHLAVGALDADGGTGRAFAVWVNECIYHGIERLAAG